MRICISYLAERTSGDLNAGGVVGLWVTGADAVDGAEGLQVIERDAVAEEVQEGILQHAAVAVGQDETISVGPVGVLGVELHELVEEDVGSRRQAHGRTRMAGVCLGGGIDLLM